MDDLRDRKVICLAEWRPDMSTAKKRNSQQAPHFVPRSHKKPRTENPNTPIQARLNTPELPTLREDFDTWRLKHGNISVADALRWLISDLVYGPPRSLPWEDEEKR